MLDLKEFLALHVTIEEKLGIVFTVVDSLVVGDQLRAIILGFDWPAQLLWTTVFLLSFISDQDFEVLN